MFVSYDTPKLSGEVSAKKGRLGKREEGAIVTLTT